MLERLRDPRVLVRAKELVGPPEQKGRHAAILCIERIGYALRDQESAEILLTIAARSQTPYEVGTALAGLARCTPPTRSPPRRSWSSPAILEGDELSAD
ncbi:MAG: hypothetical protein M5U28_39790 [Sandaracinaceae bacterium]|nr:hypothetical protein [Sandaracinaceae bacterium]